MYHFFNCSLLPWIECEYTPLFQLEYYIECLSIKMEAFRLNNSFYDIMSYRDIAGQDRKSGGRVLITGFGLKFWVIVN